MADADSPAWFSGSGCYNVEFKASAFTGAGNDVSEDQRIPFNLESIVVSESDGILIYPRVLHGVYLDVDTVSAAARIYTTYTEFVLADSDDPNAVPASVPFIRATCNNFLGFDHVNYYSFDIRLRDMERDAMTTRFVQKNIPPVIAASAFDDNRFPGVPWFKGAGVYKVTYTDIYREEWRVWDAEANNDYNQHVAVFDTIRDNGPTLVLCHRIAPCVMHQSTTSWRITRYIKSAEKTEHDVSWFLLDPAPPINHSHAYPLEKWDEFAQCLPEPAASQLTAFCRDVVKNPTYTRYIHRRLRAELSFQDEKDTVSLTSAILRREAERYWRGAEDTIGDREAYRSSLPVGARHVFDRYTSIRFYV